MKGMQHWRVPPVIAIAVLLSGCALLAPTHERPALPVADRYPYAIAEGVTAPALDWKDYFFDEQLRGLIALALEHNRDLRTAVLQVQEARALHGIQRAERLPGISLGADATRGRTPGDLSLSGEPSTGGSYQIGLGVNAWELDFWGRVRNLQQAVLQDYLATDQARRIVQLMLVTNVADGYYRLRELDERIALADRMIASHEETLRIFTRRVEVGSTSRLDLMQVQTLLSQAQSLGTQLHQARATQSHALTLLVGAPFDLNPARGSLDGAAPTRALQPGLPSDLLLQRPDILAAEHRLRAAEANIGAARAAFFPRITLTGSVGTASAELDGLFASGSRAWSFAPSISLPIFDGGRRRASLNLAEVRRDLTVAHYESTVQTAFREVSDALASSRWLALQVSIQQNSLDVQTERARLARLRYDNGAAAFLEVLDAQRELLTGEQQLTQTRRALISAHIDLYAALGGGAQSLTAGTPAPVDAAN
ncbi:efflux transporter outer membrane subunit [Rhodoferax ferrireducens]|uniref:efflux transporter outer membrane subunit n=1 Tax=Rhodoferax ferrireducens TaxID=192843 RepID=UPI0018E4F87A|nr:efflux transporter outer membrane subunit [Rhodoferax ferrireducens]